MSTAFATKDDAPTVTADQLALIQRTIAKDATADELKLYLYDCARQGVHPLDKLIHFTKHSGKYAPVTSIDFMRTRAADTGEYAGSDVAQFVVNGRKELELATVTVWRLVQGQRCPFTATARWSEYKPEPGASGKGDRMWQRMPYTMLAKCAEALALRKGFPRQLAGLYAKEEMDQSDRGGYIVVSPTVEQRAVVTPAAPIELGTSVPNAPVSGHSSSTPAAPVVIPPQENRENAASPDAGEPGLFIQRVEMRPTKNENVRKFIVVLSDGREVTTIKERLGSLCEQIAQEGCVVMVDTKSTKWGEELVAVHRVPVVIDVMTSEIEDAVPSEMLTADDIPF